MDHSRAIFPDALTRAACLALATVAGCFSPTYPAGQGCSSTGQCPPGQTCEADDVCRPDNVAFDAALGTLPIGRNFGVFADGDGFLVAAFDNDFSIRRISATGDVSVLADHVPVGGPYGAVRFARVPNGILLVGSTATDATAAQIALDGSVVQEPVLLGIPDVLDFELALVGDQFTVLIQYDDRLVSRVYGLDGTASGPNVEIASDVNTYGVGLAASASEFTAMWLGNDYQAWIGTWAPNAASSTDVTLRSFQRDVRYPSLIFDTGGWTAAAQTQISSDNWAGATIRLSEAGTLSQPHSFEAVPSPTSRPSAYRLLATGAKRAVVFRRGRSDDHDNLYLAWLSSTNEIVGAPVRIATGNAHDVLEFGAAWNDTRAKMLIVWADVATGETYYSLQD